MGNLVIAVINAWAAKVMFEEDSPNWGWANLVFSALNFALFLRDL